MFNAMQGVDTLLGGLGAGMRDIQAAQARRAREKYERENGPRWVAEYDHIRIVNQHNVLAARFNKLVDDYDALLAEYNRINARDKARGK